MIAYKNTKAITHPPDRLSNFFDIVDGFLQGDTLAPYLFIIFLDYVLRMLIILIKENGFTIKTEKKQKEINCRKYN